MSGNFFSDMIWDFHSSKWMPYTTNIQEGLYRALTANFCLISKDNLLLILILNSNFDLSKNM
jgi:hypothetical protein